MGRSSVVCSVQGAGMQREARGQAWSVRVKPSAVAGGAALTGSQALQPVSRFGCFYHCRPTRRPGLETSSRSKNKSDNGIRAHTRLPERSGQCEASTMCEGQWIDESLMIICNFLRMIYRNSSPMTIPMDLWRFGPMKFAMPVILVLFSRKLYPSGGKLTQGRKYVQICSSTSETFPNIDTEIGYKRKYLFWARGLCNAKTSSQDDVSSWTITTVFTLNALNVQNTAMSVIVSYTLPGVCILHSCRTFAGARNVRQQMPPSL